MTDTTEAVATVSANESPIVKAGPFDHLTYTGRNEDGTFVVKKLMDAVDEKDIWSVNGGRTTILSLRGFQKLAELERVVEKNIRTEITPTADNKQQHALNVWLGFYGEENPDNWRRASGEASTLNTGKVVTDNDGKKKYIESGQIDASYRYAMADKRAFCRAMQKLLNLQGVYADVEAATFSKSNESGQANSATDFDF